MKYSYQGEDENCFHLQHPDGSAFRIAKAGLQKSVMDKISAMKPVQMAEGGIVPEPDKNPVDDLLKFDPTAGLPAHVPTASAMKEARYEDIKNFTRQANAGLSDEEVELQTLSQMESEKAAEEAMAARAAQSSASEDQAKAAVAARKSALLGGGAKILSASDQAAQEQEQALQEAQGMQSQGLPQALPQAGAANAMGGIGNEAAQITKDMSQAYTGLAQEQEKSAAEQEKIYAKQAQDIETLSNQFNEKYKVLEMERETLMKDIADDKIDPRRMFNEMSSGRKVMTTIGLLLSGIGAGVSRTENDGLNLLNKMVDRDIEAQKLQMGKKQNLLSINMQQSGDLRQAEAQTKLQMAAAVEAKIRQVSAQSQSAQAKLNGQMAIAKIRAEMLPLQMKVAGAQAQAAFAQQGSPLAQRIQSLPENMRQEAWKELGEYQSIQTNIQRASQVIDEAASYTSASSLIPYSQAESLRETAFGKLFPIAKAIAGERMTDADAKTLINPFLPKVTDTEATIKKKKQGMIDALNAQMLGRIPRLVASGIIQPPKEIKSFRPKGK